MSKKEKKTRKPSKKEQKAEAKKEEAVAVAEPKEEKQPAIRHICQCCKIREKHGYCKVLEKHVPRKGGTDCGAFDPKK